ncbi:MAG: L,D-transpeptidase [Acidobacteria bacterium]|nr:L,D-transpeptidase [Acidobacteriota bacterium]
MLPVLLLWAVCGTRSSAAQNVFALEPVPKTAAELRGRFTPVQIDILEKLNRRDREHIIRADPSVPGLVVPAGWQTDSLAYSPLPLEWPAAADHLKYLVVHQPSQVFGAYESGKLVRWGPVSSGRKETPTPPGAFNLTWRSRKRISTDNESWVLEWYFNFVNARGISFHQFDLPGYAASHACVRLLQRDAEWLYGWGDQWKLSADQRNVESPGNPVLVLGDFGHGQPPPWTSLEWLATVVALPTSVPPPFTPGAASR